ncbi:MAG: di-trans,poly-cis-decaprenylcistransferase [Clostridia bacterium]|nr:di-trans,poly-cis-decaprenylcistransferase [Clostridia bacterium]
MSLFEKENKNPTPVKVDEHFRHIAFIMDGNGRWAKKRGMPREYGHKAGAETFRKICSYCHDVGFKAVTVYAFSTENWKRPKHEVDAIMNLLGSFLDELMRDHEKYQNRIRFIGDTSVLSPVLKERIAYAESLNPNSDKIINIALNYGGRAELAHAFNSLVAAGNVTVTEEDISNALYTAESGDPDMIVRTGGDLRISNFLLWQAAYAELYFTDKLWPDLTSADVDEMIRDFYSRKRRYGGL